MKMKLLQQLKSRVTLSGARPTLFGAGARVFALASQLLILIIMSRLLPKSDFGDAMIVFTIYRLLNLGIGSGFGSIVLYHVGRKAGDAVLDIQLMRTVSLAGAIFSIVVAFFAVQAAPTIASLFSKQGMTFWLVSMSPMIVFGSLLQITASSFDGRSQVTRSIIITELMPNVIRILGFSALALFGLGGAWISVVLWVALALPWLVDVLRLFRTGVPGLAPLTLWDIRYGAWLGLFPLLGQQLQGIDMLLVGALFSSDMAAEYSIASRLASFYPFLMQIVSRTITPKMGALLHDGDLPGFQREMQTLRYSSLLTTAGLAAAIIIASPLVAHLSGDYMAAIPIMVALVIAPLIRTMFVGIDIALRMRGHGAALAGMAGISGLCLVVLSWALHGLLGIYALPVAMAVSAISINWAVSAQISRSGIHIFDNFMSLPIGVACVVLSVVPVLLSPMPAAVAAATVLAVLAVLAYVMQRHRRHGL